MTMHKDLAAGQWFQLSFCEQMANVGSEIERALSWRSKGRSDFSGRAFERALELLDLSVADGKNRLRLGEILRVREALVDHFVFENSYQSTADSWRRYFGAFLQAVRGSR